MIIDLTHSLQNDISVYPGTRLPRFLKGNTIEKDGFAEIDIEITSHSGTHMDAPCHILPGTKSLDKFSIEKFIGPGCIVDCRGHQSISKDLIKSSYNNHDAEFVLFYTGWEDKWMTKAYYEPFPVLEFEAIRYLLEIGLKGVGFDCLSPDGIDDQFLANHHLLLTNEVLIIENLCNLQSLINKPFEFNAIPIKIKDADGSPIRAFAKLK